MKYYVTSGCSYSNETNTWSVHLKKYIIENELGECYNFGSGGGGIDWTRRSIMQGVLDLLGSGVSNDDIKVIVSWPWRKKQECKVEFMGLILIRLDSKNILCLNLNIYLNI